MKKTTRTPSTESQTMKTWNDIILRGIEALLDALWPRMCVSCHRRLLRGEQLICTDCLSQLPLTPTALTPTDNELMLRLCGWGRVEKAVAAYCYEQKSLVSRLIVNIKYHGHKELGVMMGHVMAEETNAADVFADVDAIVPLPLHRRRQKQRGYNQSEMIARGVAEILGKPVLTDVVERVVYQVQQVKVSTLDRHSNIAGAFGNVNAVRLQGMHILIVDDVVTTGTTVGECISALQTAVPELRVSVLALSMAI